MNQGAVSWFCPRIAISDQKLFPLVGFSVLPLEDLRRLHETWLFPPTMKTTQLSPVGTLSTAPAKNSAITQSLIWGEVFM